VVLRGVSIVDRLVAAEAVHVVINSSWHMRW
jgi:hypothetical protein